MAVTVRVRLNAILRRHARSGNGTATVCLAPASTISDLVRELGISPAEVAFAAVNHKYAECSRVLQEGDEVILYSPLTGG